MSALTLNRVVTLLQEYVRQTGSPLHLLLIGRLALQAYGSERSETEDLDAEVAGDFDALVAFLKQRGVPTNLSENISGWSVVAMPPRYRERASVWLEQPGLCLRLLHPTDFIIAKLRRGTDLDLDDAEYVARRFAVEAQAVRDAAEAAVAASPKDTALFAFRKTVTLFCARLAAPHA